MRYMVLACDYDGTIAEHGTVTAETVEALGALKASGRRLLLVTGRQLDDLERTFPHFDLFDRIVAENGALLYDPETRESRTLAEAPPQAFVQELVRRRIEPLSVGHVIVATWEPHDLAVLATIRDLGLELQVIFNKGAVMVLPSGVNKATGMAAALEALSLSPHNVVGVGDAENDHAFLAASECAVAVANALPSLKERVDLVTRGDHGAGVIELIGRLLDTDLRELEGPISRHDLRLGCDANGQDIRVSPYATRLLIAGPSGVGKSTIAQALLEEIAAGGYQFCIVDPEGDYQDVPHAVCLKGGDAAALADQALQVLDDPRSNLVLNLIEVPLDDRPAFFQRLLPRLQELRTRTGRPHWTVVDEAHHLLPREFQPSAESLSGVFTSVLLVTVHPAHVSHAVLNLVSGLIAVGDDPAAVVRDLPEFRADLSDTADNLRAGRRAWLFRRDRAPVPVLVPQPARDRQRHRRKYAEGELDEDRSFYFQGPDRRLNLRAQNLVTFTQLAEGVDDDTWTFHLRRGDVAHWFRAAIKDEVLAATAAEIEHQDLPADESRRRVLAVIRERYTAPT